MSSASDDFNRADSSNLGSTNWIDGVAGMSIVGNVARAAGGSQWPSAYWASTFSGDHYSEVKVSDVAGNFGGPLVRHSTSAATYYFLQVAPSLDNSKLIKVQAGGRTELINYGDTPVSGATYRLEANGSRLRSYRDGVQLGTDVTDTSITGGQPGISGRNDIPADLNDWAAADVSTGGGGGSTNARLIGGSLISGSYLFGRCIG
jgi:hypothetical protein